MKKRRGRNFNKKNRTNNNFTNVLAIVIVLTAFVVAIVLGDFKIIRFAPGDKCEVKDSNNNIYANATHDSLMWVVSGYTEERILCYDGKWWEVEPADVSWQVFINSENVVESCTQVGSWYVNEGDEEWTNGTAPAGCGIEPPGGLVAYYSFENNADDSFGDNDGVNSGVEFVDGKIGKAGKFNGSDYIEVFNFRNISGRSFSVSFWSKPDFDYNNVSETYTPGWMSWTGGANNFFAFYQDKTSQTAFMLNSNDGNNWTYDQFRFSKGEWIHVVGVYDKSLNKIKLYVNGVSATKGNGAGNNGLTGAAPLRIGRAYEHFYDGLIDELRIYDKALSESEIKDLCGDKCGVDINNKMLIYLTNSEWVGNFSGSSNGSSAFSVSKSSGLARADYICNHDSNKPSGNRDFKALLGTNSREVGGNGWILEKNTSYYRSDGVLIGNTKKDEEWFAFSLDNPISLLNKVAVTGLDNNGEEDDNCNDWGRGDNSSVTKWGTSSAVNSQSVSEGSVRNCSENFRIYCVEVLDYDICEPDWKCGNWTNREKSCGTRICYDTNDCGTNEGKPTTNVTCVSEVRCGNGIKETGEECDDGNIFSKDGCSSLCRIEIDEPVCGDGDKEGDEECDDGNTEDDDGCSSECKNEPLFSQNLIYVIVLVFVAIALIVILFLIFQNLRRRYKRKGGAFSNLGKKSPPNQPGSGAPAGRPMMIPMQMRPSPTINVPRPPVNSFRRM